MKVLPACIFSLFVALSPIAALSVALAQTTQSTLQPPQSIPEHVVYDFYFRRMAYLEDLAQQKEKQGLSATAIRQIVTNELGISEIQRNALAMIATQSLAEAATLDSQAVAIIERERSRYPKGELRSKDQTPEVPQELTILQRNRALIFLRARTKLSQQVGFAKFQTIDEVIKQVILQKVTAKTHP
jgi:hypothetical protein